MFVEPTADEVQAYRSYTGVGLNEAHNEIRAMRLKAAIPESKTLTELRELVGLMAEILL
jgi:hypothetical protein